MRPKVAVVLSGAAPDDPEALRRHAARWRQRFATTKRRLRALARREGLLT